eukprot:CAMPEP_0176114552 /NCGR_PEP_ID=MMETSP0120_2-20121206/57525_1 /TAXON_ID=160619 /ORGANISM="Kryptoperidinium foliaceum, Strain CCMP 1326" /LENGTH=612 /DNA_ID=CAMNT_0017448783 /DNA_START=70 /DNA_END=1908 /DNA_ORIENTATION=-
MKKFVRLALAASATCCGAVVTHPHEVAPVAALQAHARLRTAHTASLGATDYATWALYGSTTLVILIIVFGTMFAVRSGEAKDVDDGEKAARAEPLVGAAGEPSAEAASSKTAGAGEKKQEHVDFERLLKLLAKRAAQQVGPKVAKVHSVRGVLMAHLLSLKNSVTTFVMDEAMSTLGTVLREAGAEEFMLLLNPSASATASLPPVSILLAGLLSPVVLTISLVIHLSQVFLVLLPTLCLCIWALYTDWTTLPSCAVPTIHLWVFVQGGVALLLTIAHLAMTASIQSSKNSINAKIEGMKERLREAVSDGELSIDEIRELFIIVSILLEHSLVEEDKLRRSVWRTVIGYGTIFWMATVLWTFVIVLGWTFVPGMVAFHAAAASVAGDSFCGAWATVFTARLTCVLSLLFLLFNTLSVMQFVSDQLVVSEAYSAAVIAQARSFDQSMLGLPVVETVVKAFLLRGTGDSLKAQIAMSRGESQALESQRDALTSKIEDLNNRIKLYEAEAQVLKREAGVVDDDSATEAALSSAMEGEIARAKELEKATKEEIDQLYAKMLDAAAKIRNQSLEAFSSAQEAATEGMQSAQQAAQSGSQVAMQAAQQAAQQATQQMGR